jgi:hypothetical protein
LNWLYFKVGNYFLEVINGDGLLFNFFIHIADLYFVLLPRGDPGIDEII